MHRRHTATVACEVCGVTITIDNGSRRGPVQRRRVGSALRAHMIAEHRVELAREDLASIAIVHRERE